MGAGAGNGGWGLGAGGWGLGAGYARCMAFFLGWRSEVKSLCGNGLAWKSGYADYARYAGGAGAW
jgi:hypothetical protein